MGEHSDKDCSLFLMESKGYVFCMKRLYDSEKIY